MMYVLIGIITGIFGAYRVINMEQTIKGLVHGKHMTQTIHELVGLFLLPIASGITFTMFSVIVTHSQSFIPIIVLIATLMVILGICIYGIVLGIKIYPKILNDFKHDIQKRKSQHSYERK